MLSKVKKTLLKIMPKDRWQATKNKVLSTLWQCFIASISVFYIGGNLSISKDTALAFLSAFIGAVLSAVKNIAKEYKQSSVTADELEQIADNREGLQNEL